MIQNCPSCAQLATGHFCSNCGTRLGAPAACAECAAEVAPGARFCSNCGVPTGTAAEAALVSTAPARGGASSLPWFVAGIAVVSLIAMGLVPRLRSEPVPQGIPAASAPAAPAAGPGGVDLASMTPREAADRLWDRVMRSITTGDSAQIRMFVPMALEAYRLAGDQDADAHYHIGILHLLNGDPAAARAEAEAILAADPSHLFGLFTAAQAEQAQGNADAARTLYRRFQEAYAAEVERNLPEYQLHQQTLPGMRAEAEAFLASGQ